MTKLEEILENARFYYFGDPIHYSGPYYKNLISCIKQSDHEALMPYIDKSRHQGEYGREEYPDDISKELDELDDKKHQYMFCFDGTFSIVVPDDIFSNPIELDKFFRREHNMIIGAACSMDGDYFNFEGGVDQRLDIFGKVVESADNECFGRSWFWFDDEKYFIRVFYYEHDEYGYDHITVYPKKLMHILYAARMDDDYDGYDLENFFDDDQFDYGRGIVFVKDVKNDSEVEGAIREWCDKYLDIEEDVDMMIEEDQRWSAIKLNHSLNFKI